MKLRQSLCVSLIVVFGCLACEVRAAEPATPAEAAKMLDLANLPLVAGAEKPNQQRVGGLSYQAKTTVKEAHEFHKKQLAAAKWKELPGGYVSDQTVSAVYSKEGFTASLMVADAGMPGMVFINIIQHGNVDLAKLPVPAGAKLLYGGPANVMYIARDSVEKTAEDVAKLLGKGGWKPYGGGGEVHQFRNRGVFLTAMVSAAPAQMGKTAISYSTTMVSAEIPVPEKSETVQYADTNTQVYFETDLSEEDVVKYYKEELGKTGWEATTEQPIKESFEKFMIFRNKAGDLLNFKFREVEGKQRLEIRHQTAAEVAEEEKRFKEALKKKEQEKKEQEEKAKGKKTS